MNFLTRLIVQLCYKMESKNAQPQVSKAMDCFWRWHFYHQVKSIRASKDQTYFPTRFKHYYIHWINYWILMFRILPLVGMYFAPEYMGKWLRFDYLAQFCQRNIHSYDVFFVLAPLVMFTFGVLLKRKVYSQHSEPSTKALELLEDIVVRNIDQYQACIDSWRLESQLKQKTKILKAKFVTNHRIIQYLIPQSVVSLVSQLIARFDIQVNLEHVDKEKLCKMKLKLFPPLDIYTRSQLILTLMILDFWSFCWEILIRKFVI